MTKSNQVEKEASESIEEAINELYEDDTQDKEENKKDEQEAQEENSTDEVTEGKEDEDTATGDLEDDKADDKEIIEDEEVDLDKTLSGHTKEFRELVKSIDNQELREKVISEGKLSRAELDRIRLELGNLKKDHSNFQDFDTLYKENPKLAIQSLITSAKKNGVNLDDLVGVDANKTVEEPIKEEDDYRTPEEKKTDQTLKTLLEKITSLEANSLKQQQESQRQQQVTAKQEVNDFINSKDEDGNLKHPHFEKVKHDMSLFFNDKNPDMTFEKAYDRALLLDPELLKERDDKIAAKSDRVRKEKVEKAKKLKKQSTSSSKVDSTVTNPDANMDKIVAAAGY